MTKVLYRIAGILFLCNIVVQADSLATGRRFEISGYLSMVSYGKNISLQSDITGGVNVLGFLNFSIGSSLGYRNYSLTTLDFLSVSVGKSIHNNEIRAGGIAGIYTLWFSGYQAAIPCVGGEIVYSFNIVPNFSIRIKERACCFIENQHNLFSTATFMGFCFAFYSPSKYQFKDN
jgi:hypothetical protein